MIVVVVVVVAGLAALIGFTVIDRRRELTGQGEGDPNVGASAPDGAHTTVYHVNYRVGLVGVLAGESLSKALRRTIEQINADSRRVVFMVKDRWSIWAWLGALLLLLLTLGLVGRAPGYLVVTERRDSTAEELAAPKLPEEATP